MLVVGLWATGCHADEKQVTEPAVEEKASAPAPEPARPKLVGELAIVSPDKGTQVFPLEALSGEFPLEKVVSEDPNYGAKKSFFALPLGHILKKHLSPEPEGHLLLKASDGYAVEVAAERLYSGDAYLAVGDREPGVFSPIGHRKANAGPAYLIWKGEGAREEKVYPRPWALVSIELLDTTDHYEHTRPEDGFGEDELAKRGYETFSASCLRCHAINREGGRVGPDLNVPQNILSYRPEEQVRAYIRDPRTFRYSSMPAHPGLSDGELDALIAYLRLMGEHQNDSDAD